MAASADGPSAASVRERLVQATIRLLAEEGPSAIKARAVAEASGLSTMAVYSYLGGIAELVGAVADQGFRELDLAFREVPVTEDPVGDLFALALATLRIARENPHLYDLMFGLSTRATHRPPLEAGVRLSGRSPAFRDAYAHITDACGRLLGSGRIIPAPPEVIAAALWSAVHGYITLEAAEHFADFDDPVRQVLLPLGVALAVGLGDSRERAQASHEAVLRRPESLPQEQPERQARG